MEVNLPKSEHKYSIFKVDTDAITIGYTDGTRLTDEECHKILAELNSVLPEKVKLEWDALYRAQPNSEFKNGLVVIKSKNYITNVDGKIKLKGSSLIDQKAEKAIAEFKKEICYSLLRGLNYQELNTIYLKYIKESINVKDIKRWAAKKTVTKPVLESATDPSARANESKVWDAIKHLNPQEGDKVYVYYTQDGMKQDVKKGELQFNKKGEPKMVPNIILKSIDQYNNDFLPSKLVERVYATLEIFKSVIDLEQFIDYTSKKNIHLLEGLK